jgi:hypothetical protein
MSLNGLGQGSYGVFAANVIHHTLSVERVSFTSRNFVNEEKSSMESPQLDSSKHVILTLWEGHFVQAMDTEADGSLQS